MAPLPQTLRRKLEAAVKQARFLAEGGARSALQSLAVHHHEPHASMTPEQRKLRNRLRAHGRQFGDRRDDQGGQRIDRLLREVAYEHWHRMLFARFLAENELLIEPSNRVAVSLGDVEDLARERGLDPWSMAANFAQRMLPQIFRTDDPVLQVALPPETTQALQHLVLGLDPLVFRADDALGWTYQFWQSAEKDAVNARVKSGEKVSGETLPAVTQLFTEHYMVQFLLHNTLGAWHAGKVLAARPELATTAQSEGELRAAVALPGYTFDFLRFAREGDNAQWRPAAGVFPGWPLTAKELKVLDPCCGSGHFLVAGFELLAALRKHEEQVSIAEAGAAVLRDNLFGLELDARCVQIAAFALAMAAWKRAGGFGELPPLQVACCGVGPTGTKEQWLRLAEHAAAKDGLPVNREPTGKEETLLSTPIRNALEDLYLLFQKAPELGSLIDPVGTAAGLFQADYKTVQPLLARVLQSEAVGEDAQEQAVAAQGMAKAAAILGQTFTLVATNVPYLGRGAQGDILKNFADHHYPDARSDLSTVFAHRALAWLGKSGTMAVVTPQNWLFLSSSRRFRERLIAQKSWHVLARLGPGAFETISGHVVNVALMIISGISPSPSHMMAGIDVSSEASSGGKASLLRGDVQFGDFQPPASDEDANRGAEQAADPTPPPSPLGTSTPILDEEVIDLAAPAGRPDGCITFIPQAAQLKNPNARILTQSIPVTPTLLDSATVAEGSSRGDTEQFDRFFWELPRADDDRWTPLLNSPEATHPFAGRELLFLWENGKGTMANSDSVRIRGTSAWNHRSVFVARSGDLRATLSYGEIHAQNGVAIVPHRETDLPAIWMFCSSASFRQEVARLSTKVIAPTSALWGVPFDNAHWTAIAERAYPEGLPEPQSNTPTQWVFHGHPAGTIAAGPANSSPFRIGDPVGPDRHASLVCREPNAAVVLQVTVARLLGYRWPAELSPNLHLDMAARAWAGKCTELGHFVDDDGIVCLHPIRGEASAADRLREILRSAFLSCWHPDTEPKLLAAAAGPDNDPKASIEEWLRDAFFAEHCGLFHDRPFIWHIWDGLKDGFHALVNYHKLAGPHGEGRRTLELLTFTYLNDWIERQRADIKSGLEGADGRLTAALRLQDELKKVLEGEPPYDLFIRWKPLHQQPLGWDPDINDGVRLNIRPFLLAADVKAKGAGLLRSKVGVKWTKDRGKEPEQLRPRAQFPWFWSCDPENPQHRTDYVAAKNAAFDGVRWNELHYTRRMKEDARKQQTEGKA